MSTTKPQWVRTDLDLGNPIQWIWVSNRLIMSRSNLSLASLSENNDFQLFEKVMYDLVEELRPEWSGGVIFAIRYSIFLGCWEILYAHRSFPKKAIGEDFDRVPLIE